MKELAGLEAVAKLPGFEEAGLDTAQAVLEECAQVQRGRGRAAQPRRRHRTRRRGKDGEVTTTPGFKEAFRQFAEGGWQGLQHPAEFGGQGLPKTIGAACIEMLNSANLSFALCPLLTDGAIEALLTAGSRRAAGSTYIPKMISGEWTGTMNLTEPQAGSDLSLVRTRAEPQPDGTLQDLRHQDLHHLRRARHGRQHRPPGAGARDRRARGRQGHQAVHRAEVPGQRRRQRSARATTCTASASSTSSASRPARPRCCSSATTAVRVGYLIGQENRGLEYMFIMMNAARYAVGMQGIAVAERAYQKAVAYARERVQSAAGRRLAARRGADHPPPRRASAC